MLLVDNRSHTGGLTMNVRMILEELLTPDSIRNNNACVYVTLCRK